MIWTEKEKAISPHFVNVLGKRKVYSAIWNKYAKNNTSFYIYFLDNEKFFRSYLGNLAINTTIPKLYHFKYSDKGTSFLEGNPNELKNERCMIVVHIVRPNNATSLYVAFKESLIWLNLKSLIKELEWCVQHFDAYK